MNLKNRKVLVVGEGKLADQKIEELKKAKGNIVQVPADKYKATDLEGKWLVVAATKDSELNKKIYNDAEAAHIWVNAVDDPSNCSAILPARLRLEVLEESEAQESKAEGELLITISTSGLSPAFASWLRRRLEKEVAKEITPEFEQFLKIVAEVRAEYQKSNTSTELLDWQTALDLAVEGNILNLIRDGKLKEAKVIFEKCLLS